ncbi:DUF397 domain-containing protein [Streptomyces sp. HNM0574]|uniref:DUF397 domain-containing protein n=1 Tax=Streptomyces sp. HNM0574 TaxID=2714954 RepID=UPI00146D1064|nr:DUF397 domain-containing protein [Streptomyces sp. HNM0574]NLU70950.1 DUF397 domain-containing protein [Streptomyces sp. HNM0574]
MSGQLAWIKSSYSDGEGGLCLEWAPEHASGSNVVPVRDSKDTSRAPLSFSTGAWAAFINDVRSHGLCH